MSGLIYGALWICCRVIAKLCFRYHVFGAEHIPRKGGVLFAANHASYVDIPLLGCAIPQRVYFLGRSNLFPHPLVRKALQALGWIPLRTDRFDRHAFAEAIAKIQAGKSVVIFPEGTRSPDGRLQPGKPGIGHIVAATRCPVVPVYLKGTYQVWPAGTMRVRCHPVAVHFGEPLEFASHDTIDERARKERYRAIGTIVMNRIAELGQVPPPEKRKSTTHGSSSPEPSRMQ
ncbi:MAG: 1-acyl-sn-glycerol-3-phosphate acyltransferase [Nitrospirae bacterium]|nr:MAG: 1-acyl-sn-glycerol-3-phosphate acyltransferase [Nitrospirota bacterium]